MKIFVAGITGVLGRALTPLLIQKGYIVRALVRTQEKARSLELAGVETLLGDLLSQETREQLPEMMQGCNAVVHIATAIPQNTASPEAAHAWNITARLRTEGAQALLHAADIVGAQHYIQQSIIMAYPDSGDRWLDESTPLDTSPAREAICGPVITMENMVRAMPVERLQWCILRGGSFVGPGTMQDNLIAGLRSAQITIPCDGSNYLSPINVSDMAQAVVKALESAPAGSTFNIVDEPIRNGDYVDHLADMLGVPHPPRLLTHSCPPSFRCSNRAACETLGWTPLQSIWPSAEQLASLT